MQANSQSTVTPSVQSASRKAYISPKVVFYGRVEALTQTGSGNQNESSGMNVMNCTNGFKASQGCTGLSERVLKERVVSVGEHPLGFGLYLFDYRPEYRGVSGAGYGRQFGVMIDEVEFIVPQAVSMGEHGYKVVDYAMLGITRAVH